MIREAAPQGAGASPAASSLRRTRSCVGAGPCECSFRTARVPLNCAIFDPRHPRASVTPPSCRAFIRPYTTCTRDSFANRVQCNWWPVAGVSCVRICVTTFPGTGNCGAMWRSRDREFMCKWFDCVRQSASWRLPLAGNDFPQAKTLRANTTLNKNDWITELRTVGF